ncbi:hypothetical protein SAMN05421852_103163 [Thermoflavimicrobium dichotomicum]|uniref:Uncharacterized protein n=1 Tax=Thermoflavimicrobium dichotomicum TaxID=46223 RepID=A0A1I3MRK3_9BACL|nr:hypothetical protein SAMN05421852_103163 [Thermoflavimicrobium dichotomicum]
MTILIDHRRKFDKMESQTDNDGLWTHIGFNFRMKGVFPVSINTHYMPSFLEEFRSMKLEMMIRDLRKLSPDELLRVKQEIELLLNSKTE